MSRPRAQFRSASDDVGPAYLPEFSPGEFVLLSLLCNGHSYAEIAAELAFSERTVRRRTGRIFDRLGVSNRTEAAYMAGRFSIFELPKQP
jgi:DNA-binding NarL/FixJ family response regulator